MSEQFNEIFGGPGSGGGGSSSSGTIGTIVIGIVSSETDLNTLYPATDPKYKDGTFAIVDNLTERKIFFVKSQTWLWSEEFTQAQIDALFTLVNDLKSGFKRLGTFNPKTNTPPLPLTPSNASLDAGDYYEIAGLDAGEEFTWNSLILTNKDWIIVEKDGSDAVLKWEKRNYGVIAKDIFYDNTTSGATSTNLQDLGDELALKIDDLQGKLVYNYFVDNTAGLNAITGMTANEYAIQRDTQTVYKYSGTAWEQYDYNKSEVDNLLDDKVDKINTTAQSNIGSPSKTATITINTEGQVTALTEQDISIASSQVSQATITPTSGSYANGDTQEEINNKGQGQINEAFARIVTVENRPVGNSGEGKRYFISTPATAGIYSATEIFTESPTIITQTFTPISTYQTIFEAETQALNITAIPSGGWNTDIAFTHTNDKDFTAKVSFYNGATLLGEIESPVLAGNEKIVLSKTFPTFAFTSGNKLKFKLEAKSDHNGSISVFTNDGTNDLHIHTPVLIDVVNSAVQNKLDLKQNNIISVANQAAMLALTGKIVGDIVVREDDNNYLYRLTALPASSLSSWEVLGKDTPPIGETVEDIITTNEVITSKVNGLYAFTGTPNGGFPAGVAQGDIAQKTASVWTVAYTFINAPASIYSKSDGQTYDKKVNSSNVNSWVAKPKPTYYEIGSDKEFSTINSAFAQFVTDGVVVGTGQLYDSEINERAIFPANAQNFLLKGEGYVTRNNNLVNNLEILGHRFTLQKCQPNVNVSLANVLRTVTTTLNSKTIVITGAGQTTAGFVKYQKITGTGIPAMSYIDTIVDSTTFTISQNATANGTNIATTIQPKAPVVIDSSGTITENGVANVKKGKHAFDDVSFSTPGASVVDIFDIGNWADFRNSNFAGKEINLYTTSTTFVYITFTSCQSGVINIYSPFIVVIKAYSPSVTIKTIISQNAIIDFDKATPVAYSILRQYSLGQTTAIPLGAIIINDDVGGNLANLKCTTAYTVAVTPTTGTPIDLTKYQVQTDNSKQNITDNTLNTTSKTIVGGINELKTSIDGKVVDAINDGVTSSAPSQNAVFDALALKANQSTTYTKTETDTALALKQKKVYDYTDTEANILSINPTTNNGKTAKATDTLKEYISNGTAWEEVGGGTADGSRVIKTVTQNAHGFSVGKLLALNGGDYVLADNRDLLKLCCVGFVDSIVDVNTFVLGTNGYFTTFTGLTSNQPHFVGINGNVTVTPPTSIGTYKQMVLHAVNATEAHFFNSNEPRATSTSFPLNPFIVGEIKYLDEVADFTTIFGRWLLRNGRAISRTTYSEYFPKATVQFTGNITNGSNTITNVADITQFAVGRAIEGVGIPAGATIASITTNTITLSANATATTAGLSLRYFKYGNGDGSTTYNIEDARGRVDGAIGQGTGLTNRKAGDYVGAQTHSLAEAENGPHTHASSPSTINQNVGFAGGTGATLFIAANAGGTVNNAPSTGSSGTGAPHNIMQPTIFSKNSFVFVGTN